MDFLTVLGVLFQVIGTFLQSLVVFVTIIRHPISSLTKKKRTTPPSCLRDPSLGTHEYITANGIKFHYVSAGIKTKPLMLLVHGFPEFWFAWRYQLKEFCKDYHVVAVDMRGYGETQKPVGVKNYRLEALTEDVAQLIQVFTSPSSGKCVLVGHDWGGVVCWSVASKHPDLVSSLVVMNSPHPRIIYDSIFSSWKKLAKSWFIFSYRTPWLPEFFFSLNDCGALSSAYTSPNSGLKNSSNFTEDVLEAYKYTFSQPGSFSPPVNYYRNLLSSEGEELKNIDLPVLLLWGEDDPFLGLRMIKPHRTICSNLIIHTLPNCSHWIQQDCPDKVNQYMREFLADL